MCWNKRRPDFSLVPLCETAQYRPSLTQLTDCVVSSNFGTRLDTEGPWQGHGVFVPEKEGRQFQQINSVIKRNIFSVKDKYILELRQIIGHGVVVPVSERKRGGYQETNSTNTYLVIEGNILWVIEKWILHFREIHASTIQEQGMQFQFRNGKKYILSYGQIHLAI